MEKNKQNKKKSKLYSTRKNPIKKLQTMMVVGDPALSSRSTKKTSVAFPQTYRHFSQRSLRLALELMGAELIQILMALNSIVETLDVIEDFRLGLSLGLVNPPFDALAREVQNKT